MRQRNGVPPYRSAQSNYTISISTNRFVYACFSQLYSGGSQTDNIIDERDARVLLNLRMRCFAIQAWWQTKQHAMYHVTAQRHLKFHKTPHQGVSKKRKIRHRIRAYSRTIQQNVHLLIGPASTKSPLLVLVFGLTCPRRCSRLCYPASQIGISK
jgi:hypothetical protein